MDIVVTLNPERRSVRRPNDRAREGAQRDAATVTDWTMIESMNGFVDPIR